LGRIVLVALLLLPFAEIATFIWVGGQIGIFGTLLGIIVAAVIGLMILRLQGVGLLMDTRAMMARGEIPTRQFADGMLLALAGFFLIIPGFLSDLVGFVLLVPAVRAALFGWLSRHMTVVSTYEPGYRPQGPRTIELDPDHYRND
jgi:UPF0716 protein FxsA